MDKRNSTPVIDRRVQKTKRILFEALANLITERGYENVTIQEIIDTANVGRSTFYSHYENKDQLLFSGVEALFSNLLPLAHKNKRPAVEKIRLIYDHAAFHCKISKPLLCSNTPELVKTHILSAMTAIVRADFPRAISKDQKIMNEILIDATATALVKMLVNWLKDDRPLSPELMSLTASSFIEQSTCIVKP